MNNAITLGVVAAGLVYAFASSTKAKRAPMPAFDAPPERGPDAPPTETEAPNADAPPGQLAPFEATAAGGDPPPVPGPAGIVGGNTLAPVAPPAPPPPSRKRTMYAWVPDATMTYGDAVTEYTNHGGAGGAGVSL